ncbi:hypothetical protein [Salinibaculum rarum]|uniref:hypothetical protein n=1 Tax=Salinibaculum rarum TaxID=3058903 RepID=UPI00265E9BBD|nr:hypothetical protein [Salinibaculum sp. KK48]
MSPLVTDTDQLRTERSATAHTRTAYSAATLAGQTEIERGDILCVAQGAPAPDIKAQYFVGRLAAVIEYRGDYFAQFYDTDGSEYGPKKPLDEVNPADAELRKAFGTVTKPHATVTRYVDGSEQVV